MTHDCALSGSDRARSPGERGDTVLGGTVDVGGHGSRLSSVTVVSSFPLIFFYGTVPGAPLGWTPSPCWPRFRRSTLRRCSGHWTRNRGGRYAPTPTRGPWAHTRHRDARTADRSRWTVESLATTSWTSTADSARVTRASVTSSPPRRGRRSPTTRSRAAYARFRLSCRRSSRLTRRKATKSRS